MHYLYSRFSLREPMRFVDVWARPLVTALYALPAAWGGRIAVRCLSMIVAIACGLVAMQLARQQRLRWPALALVFTLGQPMLFLHSFDEMTELPFALMLGLAFIAVQSRRTLIGAILISLLPLARPEGFGFVALTAAAFLIMRRWRPLLLLPIPLIAWDLTGWLLSHRKGPLWRWLADAWPYAGHSLYGSGNLLAFLGQLPVIVSPLVLPATIIGIAIAIRSAAGHGNSPQADSQLPPHARRWTLLAALLPLFILLVHTLLYWTGTLASYGEVRYLLVVAPFWGVLSAAGWEWLFKNGTSSNALRWAGIAVVLPPLIANLVYPVVPVRLSDDWKAASEIAGWTRRYSVTTADMHPLIMVAHPGIFYFLDISPGDKNNVYPWDRAHLASAPPGTLLIWDPIYSAQNASAERAITQEELVGPKWVKLNDGKEFHAREWRILVATSISDR